MSRLISVRRLRNVTSKRRRRSHIRVTMGNNIINHMNRGHVGNTMRRRRDNLNTMLLLTPSSLTLPTRPSPRKGTPRTGLGMRNRGIIIRPTRIINTGSTSTHYIRSTSVPHSPTSTMTTRHKTRKVRINRNFMRTLTTRNIGTRNIRHPTRRTQPSRRSMRRTNNSNRSKSKVRRGILPLKLRPNSRRIRRRRTRRASRNSTLRARVRRTHHRYRVSSPPPAFFGRNMVRSRRARPRNRIISFRHFSKHVNICTTKFNGDSRTNSRLTRTMKPRTIRRRSTSVNSTRTMRNMISNFTTRRVRNYTRQNGQSRIMRSNKAPTKRMIRLLRVRQPSGRKPHHRRRGKSRGSSMVFLSRKRSIRISNSRRGANNRTSRNNLRRMLRRPKRTRTTMPRPSTRRNGMRRQRPRQPLHQFPLRRLYSSVLHGVLPISTTVSPGR